MDFLSSKEELRVEYYLCTKANILIEPHHKLKTPVLATSGRCNHLKSHGKFAQIVNYWSKVMHAYLCRATAGFMTLVVLHHSTTRAKIMLTNIDATGVLKLVC